MATTGVSGRYSSAGDGNWGATEPTHTAILAARLRDLQGEVPGVVAPISRRPAALAAGRTRPLAHAVRAVRVRTGGLIVALGALIEGPCECPDAPTGATDRA